MGIDIHLVISHKCQFLPWNVIDSLAPPEPYQHFFFLCGGHVALESYLYRYLKTGSHLFYLKQLKFLTNFLAGDLEV
jgi:hypothetical protein